jgi:murein DD-endopeptidase MepM/ murein hydrolase activator NlpD
LFAHKLDFERDIQPGDTFKLVFDRKVTESGRTVEAGNLLYAEIEAKGSVDRFYSFQPKGDKEVEYFDENGKSIKGFLLTTPVYGARISSTFGMRMHPILGFTKMHTGIDFAAPTGTPIMAAGDGVVEDAKWWGGYGRWVRIRHNGQWETGYGHMSAIAVKPGQHVHQGEIIGYVGTTGRSTGPHLHFEIWQNGHPINPKGAKVPDASVLQGQDMTAFRARKRAIDSMIAMAKTHADGASGALALTTDTSDADADINRVSLAGNEASPLRSNGLTPLRSGLSVAALTTTRGMR